MDGKLDPKYLAALKKVNNTRRPKPSLDSAALNAYSQRQLRLEGNSGSRPIYDDTPWYYKHFEKDKYRTDIFNEERTKNLDALANPELKKKRDIFLKDAYNSAVARGQKMPAFNDFVKRQLELFKEADSLVKNNPDIRYKNMMSSPDIIHRDIKPVASYQGTGINDFYKKPATLPVVQKPIPVPKSTQPSVEYQKKHPPIYVTNPKDPNIGFFTESGNQILYRPAPKPVVVVQKSAPTQPVVLQPRTPLVVPEKLIPKQAPIDIAPAWNPVTPAPKLVQVQQPASTPVPVAKPQGGMQPMWGPGIRYSLNDPKVRAMLKAIKRLKK